MGEQSLRASILHSNPEAYLLVHNPLHLRHNEHRLLGCLLNCSKETSKLRGTGLCEGFKSPASRLLAQLFVQVQIKENIKAPWHWPL